MRILGIDYGDSRIGMAVSDEFGWTAQGLDTICWDSDVRKPLEKIKDIIIKYTVNKIVVGLPKNLDNSLSDTGKRTLLFADELKKFIPDVNVEFWDERLTTIAAQKTLIEMNVKRKKKKLATDKIAAIYILQGFLDRQSNN